MSQKSKCKIAEALIFLLEQDDFRVITVSEICAKASISRKTFYNHFTTKEEVIESLCLKIIQEHMSLPTAEGNLWIRGLLQNFFTVNKKHNSFFQILFRQNLFHLYTNQLHHRIMTDPLILSKTMVHLHPNLRPYVIPSYTASALKFFEIWSKNHFQESESEITEIFLNVAHYEVNTTKLRTEYYGEES